MGADVEDFESGWGGPEGIGENFQGSIIGGVAVQGRDVGPDPPDGAGPEQLPAQGRATAHQEAAEEAGGGSWDYPLLVT